MIMMNEWYKGQVQGLMIYTYFPIQSYKNPLMKELLSLLNEWGNEGLDKVSQPVGGK